MQCANSLIQCLCEVVLIIFSITLDYDPHIFLGVLSRKLTYNRSSCCVILYLSPPTVGGAPEVKGTVGLTVLIASVITFIFV